jgi:hypothetical protein
MTRQPPDLQDSDEGMFGDARSAPVGVDGRDEGVCFKPRPDPAGAG